MEEQQERREVFSRREIEALQMLVRAGLISMDVDWGEAITTAGNTFLAIGQDIARDRMTLEGSTPKPTPAPAAEVREPAPDTLMGMDAALKKAMNKVQ